MPAAAAGCDYCGDPLDGRNRVERRIGDRDGRYCCLGCAFIAEQVAKGESVDGLYPIGKKWQAAYEAWLGEKGQREKGQL